MTRKAALNQLFNLIQDEYEIKSAGDIESALLDMFGSFIKKASIIALQSLGLFQSLNP